MHSRILRLLVALVAIVLAWPLTAGALSFNPDLIITDEEMTVTRWNVENTAAFLRSKGGYVGRSDAAAASNAAAIHAAADSNRLNVQMLIVMLQKESSLVEDPTPSQRRIDYAFGYGCPDTGSCNPAYKGLAKQITSAGQGLRAYLNEIAADNTSRSGWGVGIRKRTGSPSSWLGWEVIDNQPVYVTPMNAATAALFTYNPWVGGHRQFPNDPSSFVGGNHSFRVIWERYYGSAVARTYPDGSLLRGGSDPTIWLIRDGNRHAFKSSAAFTASYSWRSVISVPRDELFHYPLGASIRYSEFSLLRAPNGGVYLIVDGKKRPIISRTAFRNLGFNPEEVVPVSWADLSPYPDGEQLTENSYQPQGKLVQFANGGITFIDSQNVRHAIHAKEILKSQFPSRKATRMASHAFSSLPQGEPMKFRDGTLVTAPGAGSVYIISRGEKRPIASLAVFKAYRFKWGNVVRTTLRALEIHPTGAPLTIES